MSEQKVEASGCLGMFLLVFLMGGAMLGWLWFLFEVLGG